MTNPLCNTLMPADVRQQVEDAIQRRLYVANGTTVMGGACWWRVLRIEAGNIMLLRGDGGQECREWDRLTWTQEQWREHVTIDGAGLFRKVGFWSFTPVNNPAADAIAYCHRDPCGAGHELHLLRELLEEKP